jgi:hypothetical protein
LRPCWCWQTSHCKGGTRCDPQQCGCAQEFPSIDTATLQFVPQFWQIGVLTGTGHLCEASIFLLNAGRLSVIRAPGLGPQGY